jgi:nickel-dependent lactate racemase
LPAENLNKPGFDCQGGVDMKKHWVLRGDGKEYFELGPGMEVICDHLPADVTPERTVAEMVAESVSRPVGAPPIEEKLSPTSKVVILIDDKTRPTPQKEALPVILERVRAAGVPADRVDIIVALGTHFPMTEEEIRERVGEDIFRTYRIRNHDSAAADQVKICELSDGFPVKVNAAFAAADVRIGIGSVLPHPFNGFGGGPKIVMPGVADYDAIRYHHATTMPKGGVVGNTTTNLFHDETARIGLASGLDLSINCVLNSREEVIDVVSGHVIEAHKAAVEKVRAAYGVSLSEDADLAILSGYPYNMFPHVLKPIPMAFLATRTKGHAILVADVPAGIPEAILDLIESVRHRDPLELLGEYAKGQLVIPGAPIDMNLSFPGLAMSMRMLKVTMVSGDVTPEEAAKLGFGHALTVQDALQGLPEHVEGAKVAIFPAGGITLPLREKAYF